MTESSGLSTSPRSLPLAQRWALLPPSLKGLLLGSFAALCYSLTNAGLRQVAIRTDVNWAMWIASWKVMPTAVAGWFLMARHWKGSGSLGPTREIVATLILNGILMQFFGNVMFQFALSRIGLALSVPLCFASLITSSAILGRMILHDSIRPRTLVTMGLLMMAVVLLSQGTHAGSTNHSLSAELTWSQIVWGAAAALGSGTGFAFSGVVVRRSIRRGHPISVILGISATVGMFPACIAVTNQGLKPLIESLNSTGYAALIMAGVLNAVGFFSVSEALRYLPVVRVNLINASQAAMGGLMGVWMFQEPLTGWLVAGTLTTIASLVVLGTDREA